MHIPRAEQSGAESAMKVVLDEHRVEYARDRTTAFPLFEHLKDNGIVENDMKEIVLGTVTPRNRRGGHGAGQQPHNVPLEVAEAVLASAAVSIAYLQNLLPAS